MEREIIIQWAGDVLFDPIRETARELRFEVPAKRAQIIPSAGCALARYMDEMD